MSLDAIIYVVVALAIAMAALVLLTFLYFQRRRQRTMLLLALAQEEAERRRRKKKKVALRRWQIDHAAPEALVYRVAADPAQHKLTLQSNPEQYADAVISLRSAGHLPPEQTQQSSSVQPSVTQPPPISNHTVASTAQLPQVLVALPPTETNCVICLEAIIVGQRVRTLPCNHIYHSQCIRVWLRRKNACPCCCHRVLARRRKRSSNQSPLPVLSNRPVTLEPTYPDERRDDRGENTSLQNALARDKSSFLSRQSDDMSLDRFNSDTTSQLDEHNTAELLSQVRSALRGQSSMLSIGTTCSASPSDILPAPLLTSNPLPNELSCPEDEQQRCDISGERAESQSTRPISHQSGTEASERHADVDIDGIAPSPHANRATLSTSGIGSG